MPPDMTALAAAKLDVVGRYRAAALSSLPSPHLIGSDGLREGMSKELDMHNGSVVDADRPECPDCGTLAARHNADTWACYKCLKRWSA